MPEPFDRDANEADDDFFEIDLSDVERNNRRSAIRYVRQDITATLVKKSWLKRDEILVKLIDISSKGAMIGYANKLSIKQKVTLCLTFKDGKKFTIPATVTHVGNCAHPYYGLKFSACNDELGEYLLSSQSDLIFK